MVVEIGINTTPALLQIGQFSHFRAPQIVLDVTIFLKIVPGHSAQ